MGKSVRLGLAAAAIAVLASAASAQTDMMGESQIRGALAGKSVDGVYPSGEAWSETYHADGRIDYHESNRKLTGRWTIEGFVFCTLYDGGHGGGCWRVRATGENCFVFHLTSRANARRNVKSLVATQWGAMAWQPGKPSTCEGRPTV